ncbi:hypothetical protein [Pseudomonas aeruginosa]|uniref:hypothetical protein n=1 Tax=Pseudomonas aeruginosa TaxID=287 RepID=UPI001BAA6B14|nr:hypothetical protein [Pseudomonas aeruginosa]
MAFKRIALAYCVQLDRVISIASARREYFSQAEPRKRFDFFCSSEGCRAQGIKVSASNYDKLPQDTRKAAHFSKFPHSTHLSDCEWFVEEDALRPGESAEDAGQRRIRDKLDAYVEEFDPAIAEEAAPPQADPDAEGQPPASAAVRTDAPAAPRQRTQRPRRTRDFELLVDTFRQARAELPAEEFKQLDIRISGLGRIALRAYFQHIGYATPGSAGKVFYGGADLVRRYGAPSRPQGFRFKFRDRIDGKPVFLYVAPETLQGYPHRRYLEDILGCAETVRYFTLYALGRLVEAPSGKSYSLEPDALRHLAIIPGPAKDDASQSSS